VSTHGCIIILNGAPRSGKTSIARAIKELGEGQWLNIGVDFHIATLPERLKPGIGLRPGGERPDIENDIPALYAALFTSIAAHAKLGFNVVADVGIHDGYSRPLGIWQLCAKCLDGLDAFIIGVRCNVQEITRRRETSGAGYVGFTPDGSIPDIVHAWENAVHDGRVYDLELDASKLTPQQCCEQILSALGARSGTASKKLQASTK
jgi:chloramphenicol 3-O phosphotransferase